MKYLTTALIAIATFLTLAYAFKTLVPEAWADTKQRMGRFGQLLGKIPGLGLYEAPMRYGPSFAATMDDSYTDFKYKERMPRDDFPTESFQGLLPASNPEADAFVPSLDQAAQRPFIGMGQMKSMRNHDLRGYSADEIIPPSDVVPFGQSTLASADSMGIGQASYRMDKVGPAPLLTSFAKNNFTRM